VGTIGVGAALTDVVHLYAIFYDGIMAKCGICGLCNVLTLWKGGARYTFKRILL
jgi:hypothetical protein